MSDLLSTSVSGLLAFQKALSVTSNNVSNVATPGYSVERANFSPQLGVSTSVGNFGAGVEVTSVTRSYSELLAGQMRTSQSSYSGFNSFATTAVSRRREKARRRCASLSVLPKVIKGSTTRRSSLAFGRVVRMVS